MLDILMIAKYLERIGDHATNIAEWVEFSITGAHKIRARREVCRRKNLLEMRPRARTDKENA